MTKYRQKDNEAVLKVTNDVEVCLTYDAHSEKILISCIVLAIQDRSE
jgi:hypothetical protein